MTQGIDRTFNAALAGHLGLPVALVTGDRLLVEEARAFLEPSLEPVIVKEGLALGPPGRVC